jgi:hypothetical protein
MKDLIKLFILKMASRTAVNEALSVPDCNDSFFGKETSCKFTIKI